VLGELQQAPLNEWVRIVSKRADQFCLLAAEIFVHLSSLMITSSLLAFMSRTLARTMMRATFPQKFPDVTAGHHMCRLLAFPKSDLASGGQRDLVDLVEMGLQVSRHALGAGLF
jgi:hypothetical protein